MTFSAHTEVQMPNVQGSSREAVDQPFRVPMCHQGVLLLRRAEELDLEVEAELEAYQRQYEDDHSWELLQEDEFGRLRPLASDFSIHADNDVHVR